MGEFDDREPDSHHRDAESADGPVPGAVPAPAPPAWRVRARARLTPSSILAAADIDPDSSEARGVLALHESMRHRAVLYAEHLEMLAAFFLQDTDNVGQLDEADVTAMKIATGLRVSGATAWSLLRDAHRAVVDMPETFGYLSRGEISEDFHRYLLRHVRRLTPEQAAEVDAHMAGVELPSISRVTFEDQVRLGAALATAGALPTPPSSSRDVEIVGTDTAAGTASLLITGPIPEIHALARRLDIAARTVQKAQRDALEEGAEGPLPFDIDRDLGERGRALSLRTLRYAILVHSVLDIDPVQETASMVKILVTVPVTTLMGLDDAPALMDGITPIPAELARGLAAGETTWQRILTDAVTGGYLPVHADTYRPPAQLRQQLRLRHSRCAAPGCDRPTAVAAEDDHIIEYDHQDPARGGQTSLWNLHRLCWQHHREKTAALIDPDRDPRDDPEQSTDGSTTAGPIETRWTLGDDFRTRTREHTDLLTPHTARALDRAWAQHQRDHEGALRLHAQQKARPRAERAAEERAAIVRSRRRERRVIPVVDPRYEQPPPF